jgi:hypothetical protein
VYSGSFKITPFEGVFHRHSVYVFLRTACPAVIQFVAKKHRS